MPNVDCLKDDVILLADTFFYIVVWKGKHIKEWVDQGYHEQPEYEHLKELLG